MADSVDFVIREVSFQSTENLGKTGIVPELQRAFDAVKIRTEGKALNPGPIPKVQEMPNDVLDGGHSAAVAEKYVIKIHTDDTACVRKGSQLCICQIPRMVLQGTAAAVAGDERFFAVGSAIMRTPSA